MSTKTIEIEKILPVMDDMDRLVKAVDSRYEQNEELDPVDSGFLIIRENLEKALNSEGIFRIRCFQGDDFDVSVHEAVKTHPLDDFERFEANFEPNQVYEVVRSGWKSGNEVLRPCQVVVTT
jgi:molecular chaperone GrpE (heat shock protein)